MFLVAYYYQKPSNNRVRTSRAGWMLQPNAVSYDEQVALTTKIKNKDMAMAKVILDLRARRVVRNSWNKDTDYESLFEYYQSNYPQYKELMNSVNTAMLKKQERTQAIAVPTSEVRVVNTATT